jgi:hypothetical protein
MFAKVLCLFLTLSLSSAAKAFPTAIFPGLGDDCIYPGMIGLTKRIATGTGAYA